MPPDAQKLSPEFQRKVLDLVKAGRPVRQVATDLQMPSQTIYVWLRQDRIDAGLEPGMTSADHAELVAARRRTAQLETELAITRRAVELVKQDTGTGCSSHPCLFPLEALRRLLEVIDRVYRDATVVRIARAASA